MVWGGVAVADAAPDTSRVHEVSRRQHTIRHAILRIIDEVQSSHDISIRFEQLPLDRLDQSKLSFTEAEPGDYGRVYRYLTVLQQELNKYPSGFLPQRYLQSVYLVKRLFKEEQNAQGVYDYRNKIIFFDFARQFGGEMAQRRNIHHEIFHVIDTNSFYWQGETDWEELNAPDFEYVRKGKVHVDPEPNASNYFAPQRKGFVTYYAMMSPYEDKAEVFASLFMKAENRLMHRWAEKDQILSRKIAYLKTFLKTYTDGVIDEDYFSELWPEDAVQK